MLQAYLTSIQVTIDQNETYVKFQQENDKILEIQNINIFNDQIQENDQQCTIKDEQIQLTLMKQKVENQMKDDCVNEIDCKYISNKVLVLVNTFINDEKQFIDNLLDNFQNNLRLIRIIRKKQSLQLILYFDYKQNAESFFNMNIYNKWLYLLYLDDVIIYDYEQQYLFDQYIIQQLKDNIYMLPNCTHCLEMIESNITGIQFNQFQQEFSYQLQDCEIYQSQKYLKNQQIVCEDCNEKNDIWLCMICYQKNCGRYRSKHAVKHFEDKKHLFSIQIDSGIIWNYLQDNFVHRVQNQHQDQNQNKNKDGENDSKYFLKEQVVTEYSYLLEQIVNQQRLNLEQEVQQVQDDFDQKIQSQKIQMQHLKDKNDQLQVQIKQQNKNIQDKHKKNNQLENKIRQTQQNIEQQKIFNDQINQNDKLSVQNNVQKYDDIIKQKQNQLQELQNKLENLYQNL